MYNVIKVNVSLSVPLSGVYPISAIFLKSNNVNDLLTDSL